MISARKLFSAFVILTASACADQGTTAPVSGASAQRSILASPTTVAVVTRNTALPAPLSSSATIGIFGGRISIPGAGLSVIIPPGAVLRPTQITATALAGNQVAYEFEPHGTQFLVPLLVTQSLANTNANTPALLTLGLKGGYFADKSLLDPNAGTGVVSELLGAAVSLGNRTVTFPVFHFSGYLVAVGCHGDEDAAGAQ